MNSRALAFFGGVYAFGSGGSLMFILDGGGQLGTAYHFVVMLCGIGAFAYCIGGIRQ